MINAASRKKTRHLTIAGGVFGALPFSVEAEDADAWGHPNSQLRLYEIVEALVESRFSGVRMPVVLPVGGAFLTFWRHSPDTAEGQYFVEVLKVARAGLPLPEVSEVIEAVRLLYRESGLTSPKSIL
jgi:hypothetical protein